ncbi:MAG: phytanoyl-CoA dioxygenase family protein [Pseudomonadota bacterium]|nr:phytanoyl-CoA dioxygenase family protein [Pseudomonadota bacterium]
MLKPPVLSTENIKAFERDGFCILKQGFSAQDVDCINDWIEELTSLPEESGKHWVYHEKSLKGDGRTLINRIENIAPYHEGFAELSNILKDPVSQLLGEPCILFKEKINFKMPGGDGFKPHQDSQAGWDAYANFFVNALVSIDDATIENGCIEICGGHHKQGLYKSWEPLSQESLAKMEFIPYPTSPGDIVFFDCFTPHQSAPNFTDTTRRIYFTTYNRASDGDHMAQYYFDKHKNFPPDIDRDPLKEYTYRV